MGAVRLGRINLYWCKECNLPILQYNECPVCQGKAVKVSLTPPGDFRPAMKADIELLHETIARQYGKAAADVLVPKDKVMILNSAPGDDRMDELVFDGEVMGLLRFQVLHKRFVFQPRMKAAYFIKDLTDKAKVVIDPGAEESILKSSNVLAPGVLEASEGIERDDEVLVVTTDGTPIASGRAKMTAERMLTGEKGVAVKIRFREKMGDPKPLPGGQTWNDAVEANRKYLEELEQKSVDFIHRTMEEYSDKDMAVSYSGGKDSLVTLSLVLKAGLKPKILFVDTGLEFPETIQNVKDIIELYDLELVTYNAGDAFWHALKHYGPPARDYRWCCKSCKLGPATLLIRDNFGGDVLTFIGQRGKESEARYNKSNIWENPWVPGQLGASPIQNWNALEVWLHIYKEDLKYNPLYDEGLFRIGCWLCPSQSLSEESMTSKHPDWDKWCSALEEHADKKGYTETWLKYNLSRWRRITGSVKQFLNQNELSACKDPDQRVDSWSPTLTLEDKESYGEEGEPDSGIKGNFSQTIDMDRAQNALQVLGKVEKKGSDQDTTSDTITIELNMGEGISATITSDTLDLKGTRDKRVLKRVFGMIYRSMFCVACGVCLGRCPTGALTIDPELRMIVIDDKCVQCGDCVGKCPVVEFPPR